MVKENNFMWIGTVLLTLYILYPIASADQSGIINQVTYSPPEPEVLHDIKIKTVIQNPTDQSRNYLLEIEFVKDGKIVNSQEFTFSLDNKKEVTLETQYTPETIQDYQIIARLYDKYKIELYDTKITQFNVLSFTGPFDISITPLTSKIRPGFRLPVTVLLENMGTKGTDVEVRMSVSCPNGTDVRETFTAFVGGRNQTEKLASIRSCDQEGVYDVYASIFLFNRTWISSSSQFLVNSSFVTLNIEAPDGLNLTRGENYIFPIKITNTGNDKITNLKFFIQNIPLEWQKNSPESVDVIDPNSSVIFVSQINIPRDAEYRTYDMRLTISSRDVLERKIVPLKIIPGVIEYIQTGTFPYFTIAIIVALLSAGISIRIIMNKKSEKLYVETGRLEKLRRLMEKLRSKA